MSTDAGEDAPNLFADTETPEPAAPKKPAVVPIDRETASVGEILQHQRKVLNLSIEECFKNLRIRKVYLEALEVEDLAALPQNQTTVRAYVQSYAKLLELEAEPLVTQFSNTHYPHVEASPSRQPRPLPPLPTNAILLLVACVLFLLIGVGLVQSYFDHDRPVVVEPKTVIAPPPRIEKAPSITETVIAPEIAAETVPEATAESPKFGLSAVRIRHSAPLSMTVKNADGSTNQLQLQSDIPFDVPFGLDKKILIEDFREVMITLIDNNNAAAGDVPYSILADSDGWISIDTLEQE